MHFSANACLLPLCAVDGMALTTVEGIGSTKTTLHPVQVNTYTLFDGFTDNTRGYFTSCVVFFRAPRGRGKMRATSKMSASIICKTIE